VFCTTKLQEAVAKRPLTTSGQQQRVCATEPSGDFSWPLDDRDDLGLAHLQVGGTVSTLSTRGRKTARRCQGDSLQEQRPSCTSARRRRPEWTTV